MKTLSLMIWTIGAGLAAFMLYLQLTVETDPNGLAIAIIGGLTAWLIGLWPVYRNGRPPEPPPFDDDIPF